MIRLIIADDDIFIRESLHIMLGMDPEIEVVGSAGNGEEALQLLEQGIAADLVLMDIRMPVCDGVEGTRRIKSRFPHVRVLVLTTFDDDEFIAEAIRGGASGYLLKNIPPDRIIKGIKTVHEGSMLIHPDIAAKLAGLLAPPASQKARMAAQAPHAAAAGAVPVVPAVSAPASEASEARHAADARARLAEYGLTPSECQVVGLIAEGLSNREIAGRLYLSEGTVKNYVTEILSKLSLRDRTQIAIFYLRRR